MSKMRQGLKLREVLIVMMRQDQAVILLAKRLRIETSPQNIEENMDVA
jgi:hypothetical protein